MSQYIRKNRTGKGTKPKTTKSTEQNANFNPAQSMSEQNSN